MPGTKPALHVKGLVTCPTSGYTVRLEPRQPQGINAADYFLDLVICPPGPTDIVLQVETEVEVHYVEVTERRYASVTILPGQIRLEVRVVS